MKHIVFIVFLFINQLLFAQSTDPWIRFIDSTNDLSGYKDIAGNIKIPLKFVPFTNTDSFYHIMTVSERKDSTYQFYYLLKTGKTVGRDSVYVFDFSFDCESEGKILYRHGGKVGFFDKSGTAIIPAVYNYASPFHNGLSIARINAERKKCTGGDCEHLGWVGGNLVLINDKNEILIDSFNKTEEYYNLNLYSCKVNDRSVDTSIFVTIPGRNGNSYSFIDNEKEFTKWFYKTFLPALGAGKADKYLYKEIYYFIKDTGWISLPQKDYLKSFPTAIYSKRFQPNELKEISVVGAVSILLFTRTLLSECTLMPATEH
ncbi:MAG: WG repeat-containing protein [Chitinophagaceae bacterium]